MKKNIAFFDFDGTITHDDSVKSFFKFMYGKTFFYHYYLYHIFQILKLKLKIEDYTYLKKKRINKLIKDFSKTFIMNKSKEFYKVFLKNNIKVDALNAIKVLSKKNFEIVIVSASYDILILGFCNEFNLNLITNTLEVIDGEFTGKCIDFHDCNFFEKVNRIHKDYNLSDYNEIYVYGDSEGDMEMMKIGTKNFYNKFKG